MYITLDQAFQQLQIDRYTDEEKALDPQLLQDEAYITQLIEVCEVAVSNEIATDLVDLVDDKDKIPAPIFMAILLMVRHLYDHRSPVDHQAAKEVCLSYRYLLQPYKQYYI